MSSQVRAIDVHAHYGPYGGKGHSLLAEFCSATADVVVARAREVNVATTIVSPLTGLMPRGEASACEGNREASEVVAATTGLLQWAIVNPLEPETYEQAAELLQQPKCVGIKLHPEEHQYPVADHGDRLFEFAASHDAVVLVHSGDPYSWPKDFIPFADRYDNISVILAHLGNGGGAQGDPSLQVQAVQESQHGNVFTDTSSSRSILPGVLEWAVAEIGAEKILFGTDTPLYHTAMQRIRVDKADLPQPQKERILRENALELWSEELFERNASC